MIVIEVKTAQLYSLRPKGGVGPSGLRVHLKWKRLGFIPCGKTYPMIGKILNLSTQPYVRHYELNLPDHLPIQVSLRPYEGPEHRFQGSYSILRGRQPWQAS